ncbi:MAG: hypothetical protein GY696_08730 [Gammaproteobacteria bacterium]|nr:hypothetical protein [Gammaproteobacteria bacterium]
MLRRVTVEAALNAELDDHLGYDKRQCSSDRNNRNGYSGDTLITDNREFQVDVPRDQDSSFEPQFVPIG